VSIGTLKGEPTAQTHIIKQSHNQLPNVRSVRQQTISYKVPWSPRMLTPERKFCIFTGLAAYYASATFLPTGHHTQGECPASRLSLPCSIYTQIVRMSIGKLFFSKNFSSCLLPFLFPVFHPFLSSQTTNPEL
jgi:hypothetical protein